VLDILDVITFQMRHHSALAELVACLACPVPCEPLSVRSDDAMFLKARSILFKLKTQDRTTSPPPQISQIPFLYLASN
jgi:hypothetical protein